MSEKFAIAGYAAVFGRVTERDMLARPGCLALAPGRSVQLLVAHLPGTFLNCSTGIGNLRIDQDSYGVRLAAELPVDRRTSALLRGIANRSCCALSVCWSAGRRSHIEDGVEVIERAALDEVSICPEGADRFAWAWPADIDADCLPYALAQVVEGFRARAPAAVPARNDNRNLSGNGEAPRPRIAARGRPDAALLARIDAILAQGPLLRR